MRFAASADWHIDEYSTAVDAASGLNRRLLDFLSTAGWVANDAALRGAEVLVVAGDLSERRHPSPWLVARIQEQLALGPDRVIVTRGNHDGGRGGRWIGDVLARDPRIEAVDAPRIIPVGDGAICALGYLDRHWMRAQPGFEAVPEADVNHALGEAFLTVARGLYAQAKASGAAWTVLACHQSLSGGLMSETQAAFLGDKSLVVDTRALASIGFEAVIAGHFHKAQTIQTDPLVAYPGSIERVDWAEADQAKGYLVVDVEPGKATMEFVPTPARRFVTLREGCGYKVDEIAGAVVRCVDVDPELDVAHLRSMLEADGAFEVATITRRPVVREAASTSIAEGLTPQEALEQYFDGDPDRDELLNAGRRILAEVAS